MMDTSKNKFKQPDAEDAEVTQKTQKDQKQKSDSKNMQFAKTLGRFSFLRLLRNFCAFCVRLFCFLRFELYALPQHLQSNDFDVIIQI
jgi:hypothetical protein